MEYVQVTVRRHQVLISNKTDVQARRRRDSNYVLPAVDRYQCRIILCKW
jgi:hypothetical protein